MQVVEVDDALGWDTVLFGRKLKLGHKASSGSGKGGHHNEPDAAGDGIACKD